MNKKIIAIAAVASIALVGIWYVAVYSAQSKSLRTANSQAATANAEATGLRSQIAVLKKEKTQLPDATAKLTSLKAALPDTPAIDKLIDDINAAATATGVDWQTLTPTKPASYTAGSTQAVAAGLPGGMQSLTVAIQVNGVSNQVSDFVNKLTGMSRLLDVTSFNLSSVGGAAKATAQINTQIFFVPPAAGSAAVGVATAGNP